MQCKELQEYVDLVPLTFKLKIDTSVTPSISNVLFSLQELVEDVAIATSSRHADLSWSRRFAIASPRFISRRSASTVLRLSGATSPPSPITRRVHNAGLESSVMILPRVGAMEMSKE